LAILTTWASSRASLDEGMSGKMGEAMDWTNLEAQKSTKSLERRAIEGADVHRQREHEPMGYPAVIS